MSKHKFSEEALQYNTRTELRKGSSGCCKSADRNGCFNEICQHMIKK